MDTILAFLNLFAYFYVGYLIIKFVFFRRQRQKVCAWCGSKKIKFINGVPGQYFWEYRNKDGSRDKRVTGNYQQASYKSEYRCKSCHAKTGFNHFINKRPSKKVKICDRYLLEKGDGDRTHENWSDPKGVHVNARSANRKGG
jgi:hypothetical protein